MKEKVSYWSRYQVLFKNNYINITEMSVYICNNNLCALLFVKEFNRGVISFLKIPEKTLLLLQRKNIANSGTFDTVDIHIMTCRYLNKFETKCEF